MALPGLTRVKADHSYARIGVPKWQTLTKYRVGDQFSRGDGRIRLVTEEHISGEGWGDYSGLTSTDIGAMDNARPNSIELWAGSDDGGDDFDSTPHLTIHSAQRPSTRPFGEGLRLMLDNGHAKNMISWWAPADPTQPWSDPTNPQLPVAWFGAHYYPQDDADPLHGHISIETVDTGMNLRTRFSVSWVRPSGTPGVAKAHIHTNMADFGVNTSGDQRFMLYGYPGDSDGSNNSSRLGVIASTLPTDNTILGVAASKYRWQFGGTGVPENGSNVGTDWIIQGLDDSGAEIADSLSAKLIHLFLRRKNGRVGLGTAATQAARLALVWDNSTIDSSVHGVYVAPKKSMTSGVAAYGAYMPSATDSLIRTRATPTTAGVTSPAADDTVDRFLVRVDGQLEWGTGAASRDTNLYRSAADTLKTDDAFLVGATLGVTGLVTASAGITVSGGNAKVSELRVGTSSSGGSGVGVIGIDNAGTAPTSNPGSGGVAYVQAGVFKFRGSTGDIFSAAKQAAVASPTADVTSLKTAVDALRAVLQTAGLTA